MTNALRLHVTGRDGSISEVDTPATGSLLALLREAGVYEIAAICGGNCSCATCHVYVDTPGSLPGPGIEESEMLDTLVHQAAASRLACQVLVSAGTTFLKVKVAPEE